MTPTNEQLRTVLNVPKAFDQYHSLIRTDSRATKTKKYNTIVIKEINLGVIMQNQQCILAVFDNSNPLLGKLICESGIKLKPVGGERTPFYYSVHVFFYDSIQRVCLSRSLGMMQVFAKGEKLENGHEAHHELHAMINTNDTVFSVPKEYNIKTRPLLKDYQQAFGYIQHHLLKTDDQGFETFIHNCRFLAERYKNSNGIIVTGLQPTETWLDNNTLRKISIEKSHR